MTTQTPATAEIENWPRVRSGFSQIFDSVSKEKRRILPESTPVIRSHLCYKCEKLLFWKWNTVWC